MSEYQYLVKQSTQKGWFFFHDENNGICFKKKTNDNWSDCKILMKDGLPDFDFTIDDNNNVNLVCQDENGNIIYFLFTDEKWHKYTILKTKSNTPTTKNFRIFLINNIVNLMYILIYEKKYLLVHQILNSKHSEPNVIDYIISSSSPYNVATDSSNNIYVYYQRERANSELGYKCYLQSNKSWGGFKILSQEEDDIEKFAQDNIDFFTNKSDNNDTFMDFSEDTHNLDKNNIEISKIKILMDMLKEEMSNYKKSISNELYDINEKFKNIELSINELKVSLTQKTETGEAEGNDY